MQSQSVRINRLTVSFALSRFQVGWKKAERNHSQMILAGVVFFFSYFLYLFPVLIGSDLLFPFVLGVLLFVLKKANKSDEKVSLFGEAVDLFHNMDIRERLSKFCIELLVLGVFFGLVTLGVEVVYKALNGPWILGVVVAILIGHTFFWTIPIYLDFKVSPFRAVALSIKATLINILPLTCVLVLSYVLVVLSALLLVWPLFYYVMPMIVSLCVELYTEMFASPSEAEADDFSNT